MRLQHVSHAVLTPATRGRRLFLGAALALGLTTTSGLITPSQAANVKLGDWDVQIDVTGSVGMSWLQKSVNKQYLPPANVRWLGR